MSDDIMLELLNKQFNANLVKQSYGEYVAALSSGYALTIKTQSVGFCLSYFGYIYSSKEQVTLTSFKSTLNIDELIEDIKRYLNTFKTDLANFLDSKETQTEVDSLES